MASSETIQGVECFTPYGIRAVQVPISIFKDDMQWIESPTSERLGFPIKAMPVGPSSLQNVLVQHFFYNIDWNSTAFGTHTHTFRERVILVHRDGDVLRPDAVTCMGTLLAMNVMYAKMAYAWAGDNSAERTRVDQRCPETFSRFGLLEGWSNMRRRYMAMGEPGWNTMLNPYLRTWEYQEDVYRPGAPYNRFVKVCMGCGSGETAKGEELRQCMGCREMWYCSGQCGHNGWMYHQDLCDADELVYEVSETDSEDQDEED